MIQVAFPCQAPSILLSTTCRTRCAAVENAAMDRIAYSLRRAEANVDTRGAREGGGGVRQRMCHKVQPSLRVRGGVVRVRRDFRHAARERSEYVVSTPVLAGRWYHDLAYNGSPAEQSMPRRETTENAGQGVDGYLYCQGKTLGGTETQHHSTALDYQSLR